MQIAASWATHQGQVRDHNEDFAVVDPASGIFIVCDGMGGHAAGEVASKAAAETVHRIVGEQASAMVKALAEGGAAGDQAAALVRHAIETASATVYQMGQDGQGRPGMGTTCTMVAVWGAKVVMGHVGDSRLYLHRGGQVYQVSDDHTFLNDAIRRGFMTPEQAAKSEHRNVITRAVGIQAGVQVDTLLFDLLPGDTLLLCSDGLSGYVKEAPALGPFLADNDVQALPEKLVAFANQQGGEDNVTAIAIRAASAGKRDTENAARIASHYDTLRKIELFGELELAGLARVLGAFSRHRVEAGTVIVREGDASDTMFFIVDGEAEVLRGQTRRAVLGPGMHFGEMALVSFRPRSATVRATKATDFLMTDRERFCAMLREDAVMATSILWRLAQTLSVRLDDVYEYQGETNVPASPFGRRTLA